MYGADYSLSVSYEISMSASSRIWIFIPGKTSFNVCRNMFLLLIAKLVPEFNDVAYLFIKMMNMTFSQNSNYNKRNILLMNFVFNQYTLFKYYSLLASSKFNSAR